MFLNLFKFFHIRLPFPVWILTVVLILLWWLITRGLANLVIRARIRTGKVIESAQMVIFLVGAILIFNITLVPIVLIAFHGMAFYALWICGLSAILYFVRVKKEQGMFEEVKHFPSYREGNGHDPFD
ncbi:MAG: hypothetical protein GF310_02020 [candidate division Zixibacteria bacterium]|nr:hypothetical protein [candidate division Zixibacteria bacterium]